MVYLRGVVVTSDFAANTKIFTLPEGYRPRLKCALSADSEGAKHLRVDIAPNGEVYIYPLSGETSGYVSLDGLVFAID